MTVRVDAAAGVVVEGDASWPLRLDCRTGTASLTVADRDIEVAPLRWRDKQRLARWAHLGPAFVAAQSVELAVPAGTALDRHTRPLVAAVAQFLNGDALPLSPELLAEVAVAVCRVTGLPPAAFDDRDAFDVESAWRSCAPERPAPASEMPAAAAPGRAGATPVDAAGTGAGAPGDPWADATRIVITPDPPRLELPEDDTAPQPGRVDPPAMDEPASDRLPVDAVPVTTPPRAEVPRHPRDRVARRRNDLPYRIAPVPMPVSAARREVATARTLGDAPGGTPGRPRAEAPTPTPGSDVGVGGPVVAPVSEPPARGRFDPPADDTGLARPAVAVDPADDEALEALTLAVADRLAEQLVRAGDELGIEV